MRIPTQCITDLVDGTSVNFRQLGVLAVAADANVGVGEGDFDAAGPWTLSNYDTSGIDISSNYARLAADDVLRVLTPTGEQTATVVSVTVNADDTDIVITPGSATGTLEVGQTTGVWTDGLA